MDDVTPDHDDDRRPHHMALAFAIERWTYESLAHTIGGVEYVGAAGLRLDDLLRGVYHREIDALLADVTTIAAALLELDGRNRDGESWTGDDIADRLGKTAGKILALVDPPRRSMIEPILSRPVDGEWTADYRDGGRPITGENTITGSFEGGDGDTVGDMTDADEIPDAPDLAAGT